MDVNNKVKELEDELKVLKAEIRNTLVDIREVILEKANPLGEEHESAFIRMDLNTTARAMAAEAAAHEVSKAEQEAKKEQEDAEEPSEEKADPKAEADDPPPKGKGSRKKKGAKPDSETEDSKAEDPKAEEDTPPDAADIPPMYLKSPPPMDGNESLAAWLATALGSVGPQQLERVIAVRRLWGDLPPSTCEALARLEELIHSSRGRELSWLRTLQVLERLTPSH